MATVAQRLLYAAFVVQFLIAGAECTESLWGVSVPAFLWSDRGFVGEEHGTSLQAIRAEDICGGLVHGLKEDAVNGTQPALLFAFFGQLLRSPSPGAARIELLPAMEAILVSANSSLTLPFTRFGRKAQHLSVLLQQQLPAAVAAGAVLGQVAIVGPCVAAYDGAIRLRADKVETYLEERGSSRLPGSTDVLIVCSTVSSTPCVGSVPEDDLAEEASELEATYAAVLSTTPSHVALYAVDPLHTSARHNARRDRLLLHSAAGTAAGNATNVTCNSRCQHKANLLQGLIVALVLLLILISGLCCAYAIDSPTRFEQSSDS